MTIQSGYDRALAALPLLRQAKTDAVYFRFIVMFKPVLCGFA